MEKSQPLIDFKELVSTAPGDGLEQLVRQIGHRKKLSTSWSGRGADGGLDLRFTEFLSGSLSKEKITWLVSCKDNAKSGKSVSERDLPNITDKLIQHKADGFLLVTTTTITTGAKKLLDDLDKSNGGNIYTLVWDSSELTTMLLEPANQDLFMQFFPQSYQKVKGLTSPEGAILAFRDQLPNEILAEIMHLLVPYSEISLKGSIIWPYDSVSATVIDQIIKYVFITPNLDEAVLVTEQIEYDAFMALVTQLHESYPEECYAYLSAIVRQHHEPDIRFNAAQFLFENYEISSYDRIFFATHLDPDGLAELYSSDVIYYAEEELRNNTPNYDIYKQIDILSSATQIDSVEAGDLDFNALDEERIEFTGRMYIYVTLFFDNEKMGREFISGSFSGYFDANGMYLEEAFIDTKSSIDNIE